MLEIVKIKKINKIPLCDLRFCCGERKSTLSAIKESISAIVVDFNERYLKYKLGNILSSNRIYFLKQSIWSAIK